MILLPLLWIGALAASGAAPRPLDLSGLAAPTFTAFTVRDGVPDAAVVAMATDADGFVWLATPKGLARYDGQRWEPPTKQVSGDPVDLYLGHDRRLWVSLYDRGLAAWDGRGFRLYRRNTGLPTEHIRRVVETRDQAGRVFAFALSVDGGLLRKVGDGFEADEGNSQLPRGVLLSLAMTRNLGGRERLWVGTGNEGLWYRDQGGRWTRFRAPGFEAAQVEDLLVTRHLGREELWIAVLGTGLWRMTDDGLTSWRIESGDLRSNRVYRLAVTERPGQDRVVWAGTRSGLVRIQDDRAQIFDRRHGLPSDVIRNLHVWHSPSGVDVLWIATEAGVARTITSANPWQIASLMGATAVGVFGVLVEPDGRGGERLWVASTQDGLGLYEGGRWRTFSAKSGHLPAPDVRLIKRVADETGRLVRFIGLDGGELLRAHEGPRFERLETPWAKQPSEAVMDLITRTLDGRHERWVATRQSGIYRFREGRWAAFRAATAVEPWRVLSLIEQVDRGGRAWLWASTNQGLARFDGERFELLGLEAGLPDADLIGLTLLPDRSGRPVLWAGSHRSGVLRYDVSDPLRPRRLPATELPKPIHPTAYGAVRDSAGRIYVATDSGVQMLADSQGGFKERVFDRRDGMVHQECNTNAQFIDAHDRFWTGTLGGLAVYAPDADLPDRRPKPLRLTHATVDGVESDPANLVAPPGARELRFDYALLSWPREAESRFRSRLIGYEPEPSPWVAQNSRVFGELSPGRYVLRVEARDFAGTESAPIEIPIDILPAWWQTVWFRVAAFALFAFAGPLFYLYRVKRLSRQRAALELLVASRTVELGAANAQLAELSRQDALTGVANRRRLDEVLEEEWRRTARARMPLSFLLLDVDLFKAYNDGHGHQAGDRCLARVARAVGDAHGRAGEVVARYGGEEFAVVIPGASLAEACISAENVRRRVLDLALPHPASNAAAVVTVSIGVSHAFPADGGTVEELVRAADRALYEAKGAGRNRVVAASAAARPAEP